MYISIQSPDFLANVIDDILHRQEHGHDMHAEFIIPHEHIAPQQRPPSMRTSIQYLENSTGLADVVNSVVSSALDDQRGSVDDTEGQCSGDEVDGITDTEGQSFDDEVGSVNDTEGQRSDDNVQSVNDTDGQQAGQYDTSDTSNENNTGSSWITVRSNRNTQNHHAGQAQDENEIHQLTSNRFYALRQQTEDYERRSLHHDYNGYHSNQDEKSTQDQNKEDKSQNGKKDNNLIKAEKSKSKLRKRKHKNTSQGNYENSCHNPNQEPMNNGRVNETNLPPAYGRILLSIIRFIVRVFLVIFCYQIMLHKGSSHY